MEQYSNAVRSTASIGGHPIHPMLVPFPIAFFVAALASDVAFAFTADGFWARVSLWLVGSGVVAAAAAAVFGLTDFLTIPRVRHTRVGWFHLVGNASVVILEVASWLLRLAGPAAAVVPVGLGLSLAATILLVFTGWWGGELAYHHMIGVFGAVCPVATPKVQEKERPLKRAA